MRDVAGAIFARSALSVLQIGCKVTKTKASKHISETFIKKSAKIFTFTKFRCQPIFSFLHILSLSFLFLFILCPSTIRPQCHTPFSFSQTSSFFYIVKLLLYNLKQQFQETNYPMFRYMYTTNNNIINNDNNNTINNIETQIFLSDVL